MIEIRLDHEGKLDEVVGKDVFVHLEQMSDKEWYLGISDKEQSVRIFLTTKRAKISGTYNEELPDDLGYG